MPTINQASQQVKTYTQPTNSEQVVAEPIAEVTKLFIITLCAST